MVVENPQEFNTDKLENQVRLQSRQIEQIFDRNGLSAQVVRGTVQQDHQVFSVRSTISDGWRKIHGQSQRLLDDVKQSLKVQSVKIKRSHDGHLQLQILRTVDPPVPLQELFKISPELDPVTAILGLDETGRLTVHNFLDSTSPNLLIIGGDDSGKTSLLRTIIASLSQTNRQSQIQTILIAPKDRDQDKQQETAALVEPLNLLPHMVTDITQRFNEIIDTLLFVQRELEYRRKQNFMWPRIILCIDSAATVLANGGPDIVKAINQIAEQGPEVGIHLVLATDKTNSELLSPQLVVNLQTKIVGHYNDADHPSLILGQDAEEATYLLGAGDFLLTKGDQAIRFQAGFIDNYELHAVLKSLLTAKPVLLAEVYQPRINLPEDTKKPNAVKKREFVFIDELVAASS